MSDVIRIMCPNLRCRSVLGVPVAARGRMVRCKHCGTNVKIPQKKEAAAPAAPADEKAGADQAAKKAA